MSDSGRPILARVANGGLVLFGLAIVIILGTGGTRIRLGGASLDMNHLANPLQGFALAAALRLLAASRRSGLEARVVGDGPGLVLLRIMAQLASVAADAVLKGVATAADIDTAMRLGTNYPVGPLEWADTYGADRLVEDSTHDR